MGFRRIEYVSCFFIFSAGQEKDPWGPFLNESEDSFDRGERQDEHAAGNVLERSCQSPDAFLELLEILFVDDDEKSQVSLGIIVYHRGEADGGPVPMDVRKNVMHSDRVHDSAVIAFLGQSPKKRFRLLVVVEDAEEELFHGGFSLKPTYYNTGKEKRNAQSFSWED